MTWRVNLRAQKDAQKQLARTSLIGKDLFRTTFNLVPRASFPLTSGRKTRALGASISGMRHSMPYNVV